MLQMSLHLSLIYSLCGGGLCCVIFSRPTNKTTFLRVWTCYFFLSFSVSKKMATRVPFIAEQKVSFYRYCNSPNYVNKPGINITMRMPILITLGAIKTGWHYFSLKLSNSDRVLRSLTWSFFDGNVSVCVNGNSCNMAPGLTKNYYTRT